MLSSSATRMTVNRNVVVKVAYKSNVSRSLEVVELIIRSGTYKVCDSMRPAMLLFLSRCASCLCNSLTRIYYAQYNQMTDFETE